MLKAAAWLLVVVGVILLGTAYSDFSTYTKEAARRSDEYSKMYDQQQQTKLDETKLNNSMLADEIARDEGHPSKRSQTATLQAIVDADKLQESLDATLDEVADRMDDPRAADYSYEAILGFVFSVGGMALFGAGRKKSADPS